MKRVSVLLLSVLAAAGAVAQTTCQTIGTSTFCSDGRTYNQVGNTTFGSDGSSANRIGNTVFVNPAPVYTPPAPVFRPVEPVRPFAPQRQCGYNVYGRYVCY